MAGSTKRPRKRVWLYAAIAVSLAGSAAFLALYTRFIGFASDPLEEMLPADTVAFASVSHVRRAALGLATDTQSRALYGIVQAVLQASRKKPAPPGQPPPQPAIPSQPETPLPKADFKDLAPFFRTQALVALLPHGPAESPTLEPIFLARFSGSASELSKVLRGISNRYQGPTSDDQWTEETWDGKTIYAHQSDKLAASGAEPLRKLGIATALRPAWCIDKRTLVLARDAEALKSFLTQADALDPQNSIAAQAAVQELSTFVPALDVSAFVSIERILPFAEIAIRREIEKDPKNPLNFVSLRLLAQSLGITEWKSVAAAAEISGDQTAYFDLRYGKRTGLLTALRNIEGIPLGEMPLDALAQEHVGLNAGTLLSVAQTSIQNASPLSILAFLKFAGQYRTITGGDLAKTLQNGFRSDARLSQTLDIGTVRAEDGRIRQAVVWDAAFEFALDPNGPVTSELPRIFAYLKNQYPASFYLEDDGKTLHVATDDATLTGGRIAASVNETRLAIGYGTLRCFQLALESPAFSHASKPNPSGATAIGEGVLRLSDLPQLAYELAPVFFHQLNPDSNAPQAFLDFDWSQLAEIEQTRIANTIDDGEGHLYRLSRKR